MNNLKSPQLTLTILELESKQPAPLQVKEALETKKDGEAIVKIISKKEI